MLGDTFVLPHSDGDVTCTKINQDAYSSEYLNRDADREVRVKVRHSNVKASASLPARERHNVEVTVTTFATAEVAEDQQKFYVVLEQVPSNTDVLWASALCTKLVASTNALLTSLLKLES